MVGLAVRALEGDGRTAVLTIEVNSEEDIGMQQVEAREVDSDQVVLMAWDTGIPPWRRTYTVRDRWLKRGNDEGWHRRRHREWKSEHWRGSSPQRTKAKGKGKQKQSRMATAKPFSIWTARGRHDGEEEDCQEEQDDEVAEVDADEEQPSASRAGPRPDNEPFTIENAMHLWREFLDMEDDGGLGYPEWALDRVRDTIEEWPAEDVSILLAARQQFMGLVMAQVAEIAQRRTARAREENANPPERDETSLMQASQYVRPPETGISTFGLELQFMTDELSAMEVERARVRSSMLRGLLARRYGCASGRQAMGTRAMALEAAAVAFDDGDSAVESEVPESAEDRQWGQRWWKRLLGPIVEEERQLREKKVQLNTLAAAETVEESLDSVDKDKGKEDDRPEIDVRVQEELEMKRQIEEDDARERQAWEKERQARELLEYERDRAEQEKEDEARYEALQAQYAQEWDDWVLWRSMHSTSPTRARPEKKQKMVLHLQVQGELAPAKRLDFNVTPGMPVTVGLTWTVVDEEAVDAASKPLQWGERASGSGSSTERVSPLTPEQKSEQPLSGERTLQGSGQGHI